MEETIKGNTVGSTNTNFCKIFTEEKDAYIFGLWCADGYHRTSSIGLTNINWQLIIKFKDFLEKNFVKDRVKMVIYEPIDKFQENKTSSIKYLKSYKAKNRAYRIYVNCRPLLRELRQLRNLISKLNKKKVIWAYMAGRFDGDGSIDKQMDRDLRIVYSNFKETKTDHNLLKKIGFKHEKVYNYRKSKTFCLYISRYETRKFIKGVYPYSVRMQKLVFVPRRDFSSNKSRTKMIK